MGLWGIHIIDPFSLEFRHPQMIHSLIANTLCTQIFITKTRFMFVCVFVCLFVTTYDKYLLLFTTEGKQSSELC